MNRTLLRIDFRQTPRSAWRLLGWLLFAAAGSAAAYTAKRYTEATDAHDGAQSRHARLTSQLRSAAPLRTTAPPDAQTSADVARANLVIDQLTVPWDTLFEAVEKAAEKDRATIALLALVPNARDGTLRLAGEGRSIDEVLGYVDRVAAQPVFTQVHLLGYRTEVRDGQPVIAFTLSATWKNRS